MARARGWKAVASIACALTLALTAAACSSSSDESGGGNATGVTDTTIKVGVAVADLDGLRTSGFQLAAALTTQNLSKRVTSYFDEWNAAGGINGRTIEPVILTWDPVKPATQQKVCDDATINNDLFAFINASGMGGKYIDCIAQAGVPVLFGEVAPQSAHDTGWLLSISPSAETNATAGINAAIEAGQIPKGAKVGIITGNGPEHLSALDGAKPALEANGNTVTTVQVNTLGGDTGVMSTEAAAGVNTFKAAGVTNVVVAIQFTSVNGFWDGAAGNNWTFTFLDVASSSCTAYGAKSMKAAAVGGVCFTTFGDDVTSDGKLVTETAFEKECRAHFDAISTNDYAGAKSYPGVPSGETRTLPDGTAVSSDYSANDCTLSNVLKLALEKAGKNLTRESFMKATHALGDVPLAKASNGKGLGGPATYLATLLHGVKLTAAPTGTAKNATGTYNGCAVDIQCWVPTGNQWYAID